MNSFSLGVPTLLLLLFLSAVSSVGVKTIAQLTFSDLIKTEVNDLTKLHGLVLNSIPSNSNKISSSARRNSQENLMFKEYLGNSFTAATSS